MAVIAPPARFVAYFPIQGFVDRAVWAASGVPGRWTSWYRTPTANRSVGGHPWSQHLVGLAADRSPSSAEFRRRAQRAGLIVVGEGDHDHIQSWRAGTLETLYA